MTEIFDKKFSEDMDNLNDSNRFDLIYARSLQIDNTNHSVHPVSVVKTQYIFCHDKKKILL